VNALALCEKLDYCFHQNGLPPEHCPEGCLHDNTGVRICAFHEYEKLSVRQKRILEKDFGYS
jgi:hypothetical protein